MNRYKYKYSNDWFAPLAGLILLLSTALAKAQLDIADKPLYLSSEVDPNILLLVDDSGSMLHEVILSAKARELHPGEVNERVYSLKHDDPGDAVEAYQLCPGYNVLAYDPSKTYTPWAGQDEDGEAYDDSLDSRGSSHYALIEPYERNQNNEIEITNHLYFEWLDNSPADGKYQEGECSVLKGNGAKKKGKNVSNNVSERCAATPGCKTFKDLSLEQKENYANWYTYYRQGRFVAQKATLEIVNNATVRMGLGTLHDTGNVGTKITDMKEPANKQKLMENISKIYPNRNSNTPSRLMLKNAGEYFKNGSGALFDEKNSVGSPILPPDQGGACQKNFAVLITDGYSNGGSPSVGNTDKQGSDFDGGLFRGNVSNTLADVAMKYYESDLRGGLDDRVSPTNIEKLLLKPGVEIAHQRMLTYTAAFGIDGFLSCSPYPGTECESNWSGWPNEISYDYDDYDPRTIDDVRHAAFNGRGEFLNAQTPEDLIKGLENALQTITNSSSAAAVAVSSTSLIAGAEIYQGTFNSGDWSGNLHALPINTGANPITDNCSGLNIGEVCRAPRWDAAARLAEKDPNDRVIISRSAQGGGAFRDTNTALLTAFGGNSGTPDHIKNVINYLRGDTIADANFRPRGSVLGDIVHSSPAFVGAPRFHYPDSLEAAKYSEFKAEQASRSAMVYVGANDGMLHGFDTATGDEKLAYIPSALLPELSALTSPDYRHQYYVDGSPTTGDVYFSGSATAAGEWHTILVGGMRAGGKSIYALDITSPSNFSEAKASDIALWEFTDPNLALTFSRPDIIKMNNGAWSVVFGNGYSTDVAGNNGYAYLFVVNAEDGSLVKKLRVGTQDTGVVNGLATVTPVDIDGDFKTDYIYAGDLLGDVYRFDVTNENEANWSATKIFSAKGPDNTPQKITSRPSVVFHPEGLGGVLVMFGTGSYMASTDITQDQQTQSFYAIWDTLDGAAPAFSRIGSTPYLRQSIVQESNGLRVTSDNTIDWASQRGWFIDLAVEGQSNRGERQVTNSVVRGERVVFVTTVPNNTPCEAGGSSYLMELNTNGGGVPEQEPFDTNNDGVIDSSDRLPGSGNSAFIVTGAMLDGIVSQPTIVESNITNMEHKLFSSSDGGTISVQERAPTSAVDGRRTSWAEVLN